MLVPVRLRRVHDLFGDQSILDLADGRAPRVPDPLADGEVLEEPGRPGQGGYIGLIHEGLCHDGILRAIRLVRRNSSASSPRWSWAWVCQVTMPDPGWLAEPRVSVTVDRAV